MPSQKTAFNKIENQFRVSFIFSSSPSTPQFLSILPPFGFAGFAAPF